MALYERAALLQNKASCAASSILAATRVRDWWDYKLTPPLAVLWATAIHTDRSLLSCWQAALSLVGAIAICAAYVSLINDHFDSAEDSRSGRPKLEGLSRRTLGLLFAGCVSAGLLFVVGWRTDWHLAGAYIASWIAFTLYSAPPLRLKTRGLPGVIADAAGASVFPCMLAMFLAEQITGGAVDALLFTAAVAWSFGWGLRGILWHQLWDLERDRLADVGTFAVRNGRSRTLRVSRYVAFPIEIAGLCTLLWSVHSIVPPLLLLFYFALVIARERMWGAWAGGPLLLDEYYDGLLPVALVVAATAAHPHDIWLVAPLLLLFGRRTARPFKDAVMLAAVALRNRFRARRTDQALGASGEARSGR